MIRRVLLASLPVVLACSSLFAAAPPLAEKVAVNGSFGASP
jgi:hypothetical protein